MAQAGQPTQQQYRRTTLGNPPATLQAGELFVDVSRGTALSPTNTRPNAGMWVGGTGANDVRTVLPSTQNVPLPGGVTATLYYPAYNNQTGDFTWQPGTTSGGTVTSVSFSGGATGLTATGGPVTTSGTLTLGGTLAVGSGGTGSGTAGQALDNIGPVQSVATNGLYLTSNGTNSSWGAIRQVPNPTAGQASFFLQATGAGVYTWTQVLGTANGGTGYTTFSAGSIMFGNAQDGTLSVLPRRGDFSTTQYYLTLDGTSGVPVWATIPSAIPTVSGQSGKFLRVSGSAGSETTGWQFLVAGDIPQISITSGTTGTLTLGRGGTGVDLSTTGGTGQVLKQLTVGGNITVGTLAATEIPNIDASKIASGQIAVARGGTGQDFSSSSGVVRVSAGVFSASALVAADIPNLDASKIASGQIAVARGGTGQDFSSSSGFIKVASGTFSAASLAAGDIPNLDASKITAGTLPSAVNLAGNSATRLYEPVTTASGTTVDLSAASLFTISLSGATTLTITNPGLSAGQTRTLAVHRNGGSAGQYINAISISGASSTTVRWAGGSGAPSTGTTGSDLYQISIWCTAANTYTVLASLSSYT